MWDLHGKVAFVTGGSRGIGRAIVEALLAEGATVFFCARNAERLRRTAEELRGRFGERVHPLRSDVRIFPEVQQAFREIDEKAGALHILVNNAGIGVFETVENLSIEDWHDCLQTNLTAVFYCCKEAIPRLRASGGGFIINIGSLAGVNAFPRGAAYNASKFGLNGFTRALFQEVRYDDIRVALVAPGSVETEFHGRTIQTDTWRLLPEDIAQSVLALLRTDPRAMPSYLEIRPAKPQK